MSNELSVKEENQAIAMIRSAIYPGASDNAIRLVMAFCKQQQIDILSKAVHVVKYGDRETIVPGIGLARIKAFRTGEYVGLSDITFGPTIKGKLGNTDITYPEYATCTAKRKIGNTIAEFVCTERFVECYGTLKDGKSPTIFWIKRPFAQLAKTVESSVLKKAFPESVSSLPNFEELQTHSYEEDVTPPSPSLAVTQTADAIKAQFSKPEIDCNVNFETGESLTYDGATVTKTGVTNYDPTKDNLLDELRSYINSHNLTVEKVAQLKARYAATSFTELRVDQLTDILDGLKEESK